MRKRTHRLTADWIDAWVIELEERGPRRHLTDALVPTVLRTYFAPCDQDFRLWRDPFGRPVCPELELGFNLAHSSGLALVAVGLREKIGVDVELIDGQGADLDSLVKEHFTTSEAKAYWAASPSARVQIFFHVWTQKEAVAKAVGLGLRQPLTALAVEPDPGKGCRLIALDGKAAHGWTVRGVCVGERHKAAIAAFGQPFLVNIRDQRPGLEVFAG